MSRFTRNRETWAVGYYCLDPYTMSHVRKYDRYGDYIAAFREVIDWVQRIEHTVIDKSIQLSRFSVMAQDL